MAKTPEAQLQRQREYYRENRERILSRQREYERGRKSEKAALQRARAEADEYYWRAKRHRCTSAELQELFENDQFSCAVCGSTDKLHVDHCHDSGKLRGVLCGNCNRALGILGENPERIEQLATYARERCEGGD